MIARKSDSEADTMECNDPRLPIDGRNLVMKAVELFKSSLPAATPTPSVHISVKKRIPMQGGLGGGSSNAATVTSERAAWRE